MDENCISVPCSISGCEWRVVGDTRCPHHGGLPVYSWLPSVWGGDDAEYNAATDNEPPSQPTMPVLEGAHR